MFYETWDIVSNKPFNFLTDIHDLCVNTHFHRVFEFVAVQDGEAAFCIGGITYTLTRGDAVLIMPNQLHSVHTENHSTLLMIRFAPELAETFYTAYNGLVPDSSKFRMPTALMPHFSAPKNIYQQKSRIYEICGEFCSCVKDWHPSRRDNDILYRILMCIERDFKSECSLKAIADELKYDYTYLSKLFLKSMGMSFMRFLNDRRISHACYLFTTSECSIAQAAHESGYDSLCTFNRNFLKITGMTPSEFKREIRKPKHE